MGSIHICSLRTPLINYLKLRLPYKSNITSIKILDLNINTKLTSQRRLYIYCDYNLVYEYVYFINNNPKTIYKTKKVNFSKFIFLPISLKNIDLKNLTTSIIFLSNPKTLYTYSYNNNLYFSNKEYKLYLVTYLKIELIKKNTEHFYQSKLNDKNESILKNKNINSNISNTIKNMISNSNESLNDKNLSVKDYTNKFFTNNYQTQLSEITNDTLLQYINFTSNIIKNEYPINNIYNYISPIKNIRISLLNIINNNTQSFIFNSIKKSNVSNKNNIITSNILNTTVLNNIETSTNNVESNNSINYDINVPISPLTDLDISNLSNKFSSPKYDPNYFSNNISNHNSKLIESNVIICKEEKDLFINRELTLPKESKKIWSIEKITNTVNITKVDISNNVIFITGFIYNCINYKTLNVKISESISGPLEYVEFILPFSTYININDNYKVKNSDNCQVVSATCLSQIHKLINPIIDSHEEFLYDKILEQLIINIQILISRKETLNIYFEGHYE